MKGCILIIFVVVAFFSVMPCNVEPLPLGTPRSMDIVHPRYYHVKETESCPYGYQCYKNSWMPQVTLSKAVWVFGISNNEQCGGILNFREYPGYDCPQHCFENIPVLYTCEVVYIPPYEPPGCAPDSVPVTFIPAGKYVVTSPSFSMHYTVKLWYFPDDGTGQRMSVRLHSDELQYKGGLVTLFLQVTDQRTGEVITVDTITGEIVLPDETKKTVTTDMWSWNEQESQYKCVWDLKNDSGEYSDGKEGVYTVSVTVSKALYRNSTASTTFSLCYTIYVELVLDKDPPVYGEGAPVSFTAIINGNGSGTLLDELTLPDGSLTHLEWAQLDNVYTAVYSPPMLGSYAIAVWLESGNGICYLGGTSSEFDVIGEGEFKCPLSEGEIDELARKYAPYMYFYKGFWGEEKYFPTEVELMLENSTFWDYDRVQYYDYDKAQDKGEFIGNDACTNPEYYLDLNDEGCTIDPDLINQQINDRNLYCRIVCQQYQGKAYIVIQYRFFYIFNDHVFDHEGEWELIEVLLDYHTREPIGAAYSRHRDGEYRFWHEIEKEGTHPVAYIAKGSHGAYFTEGLQLILIPGNPPAILPVDVTSDNGWNGLPSHLFQISEILGPSWLYFGGNWGYYVGSDESCSILWNDAPRGPLYNRETWLNPVGWALSKDNNKSETLRSPYTLFSLSCPADMLITNSAGQRLGFVDGEFVQEIPGSHVQDCDEEESYVLTGIDQYTVEIFGTGEGTFDLACSINVWDNTKVIKYSDVPVNATTKAVLNLDSDLSLNVDTNQDGITDFTVSPVSIQLSSPQPIKPLQIGSEMVYEVILTNQGDTSTFVLDVDTPVSWSYSLSSDTVTLNPGESTTLLLTVTSPEEPPLQDYTIRVEATTLEGDMTACLGLIASSKTELAAENITITCKEEDIVLTAVVSNMGLTDAKNVKVQFFNGSPSDDDSLGEQIIRIPSGEAVATSIQCTLPDSFYTFSVVADPDDLISESCEFNNELAIQFLLDRTPPEAEIFFNPDTRDLAVIGADNLDPSVDISITEEVIKNKNTRTYTLTDDAGNTLELRLEVSRNNHEVRTTILNMKYNDKLVTLPKNSFKIEYAIKNGNVKMLSQFLTIGNTKVHLIYNETKNQTKIIVNRIQKIEEKLVLIILQTLKGELHYEFEII